MAQIDIPAGERGTTRVFSLSMSADEARAVRGDPAQQSALLGAEGAPLNPAGIEVFALADLGDLGLVGYLREGVDAQEVDLARDRVKLGALEGWVMLVHSLAFGDRQLSLKPAAPLTLIGVYAQTPDKRPAQDLESSSAAPYSGGQTQSDAPASRNRRGSLFVVLALVVIAGAILYGALG